MKKILLFILIFIGSALKPNLEVVAKRRTQLETALKAITFDPTKLAQKKLNNLTSEFCKYSDPKMITLIIQANLTKPIYKYLHDSFSTLIKDHESLCSFFSSILACMDNLLNALLKLHDISTETAEATDEHCPKTALENAIVRKYLCNMVRTPPLNILPLAPSDSSNMFRVTINAVHDDLTTHYPKFNIPNDPPFKIIPRRSDSPNSPSDSGSSRATDPALCATGPSNPAEMNPPKSIVDKPPAPDVSGSSAGCGAGSGDGARPTKAPHRNMSDAMYKILNKLFPRGDYRPVDAKDSRIANLWKASNTRLEGMYIYFGNFERSNIGTALRELQWACMHLECHEKKGFIIIKINEENQYLLHGGPLKTIARYCKSKGLELVVIANYPFMHEQIPQIRGITFLINTEHALVPGHESTAFHKFMVDCGFRSKGTIRTQGPQQHSRKVIPKLATAREDQPAGAAGVFTPPASAYPESYLGFLCRKLDNLLGKKTTYPIITILFNNDDLASRMRASYPCYPLKDLTNITDLGRITNICELEKTCNMMIEDIKTSPQAVSNYLSCRYLCSSKYMNTKEIIQEGLCRLKKKFVRTYDSLQHPPAKYSIPNYNLFYKTVLDNHRLCIQTQDHSESNDAIKRMILFYISLAVEYIEEHISSQLDWLISWLTRPDALALKDQLASMHTRRTSAHSTSRQTKKLSPDDKLNAEQTQEAIEEIAAASLEHFRPISGPTSRIIDGRLVKPEQESRGLKAEAFLLGFRAPYLYDLHNMREIIITETPDYYDIYSANRMKLIRIIHLCGPDYINLPTLIANKKVELNARLNSLIDQFKRKGIYFSKEHTAEETENLKSFYPDDLLLLNEAKKTLILLKYVDKMSVELKPILHIYHQLIAEPSVLAAAPEQTLAHRAGQAPASGINRLHSMPETGEEEDSDDAAPTHIAPTEQTLAAGQAPASGINRLPALPEAREEEEEEEEEENSNDADSSDKKPDKSSTPEPTLEDTKLASLYRLYQHPRTGSASATSLGAPTVTPAEPPALPATDPTHSSQPETEADHSSEDFGPEEFCSDDDSDNDSLIGWLSDEELAKLAENKWNQEHATSVHTTDPVNTEPTLPAEPEIIANPTAHPADVPAEDGAEEPIPDTALYERERATLTNPVLDVHPAGVQIEDGAAATPPWPFGVNIPPDTRTDQTPTPATLRISIPKPPTLPYQVYDPDLEAALRASTVAAPDPVAVTVPAPDPRTDGLWEVNIPADEPS